MARAKTIEPQKKSGDVMESLIDRTGAGSDDRRDRESSDDDENTFERDPQDPAPEDAESDDE
jgi:hypothetical protein